MSPSPAANPSPQRCNRRQSRQQATSFRPWQQEAFAAYRDSVLRGDRALLIEATPGAGKTTAALVLALHQLKKRGATRLGIVVPTAHLKVQWGRAAAGLDLHLDSAFSNGKGVIAGDYHGFVVTYAQVAQKPALFRRLTTDACIILDEVHHAGDGLSWGDGLRAAFHEARFIICLSGTPFRSDNTPIPFVPYDEHGFSLPDYSYSYSRAVEEGVCRPTAFFTYGGEVAWRDDAGDAAARFTDELDRIGQSRRLRAALDSQSGWITPMLKDAHTMLMTTRREHPDAGAARRSRPGQRPQACKASCRHQRQPSRNHPVRGNRGCPAPQKLSRFSRAVARRLQHGERGRRYPRLRVGVYATTVRTKMYFRQFLGRIVRRIPSVRSLQVAYCYLPADPTLTRLAEDIEQEIRHCIRPKGENDDLLEQRAERAADPHEKPSWEALTSTNSGLNSVIVHGNQLTLFGGHGHEESIQQAVQQKVSERLDEKRTRAEEKSFLVAELRKLINVAHKRSGKSHAQIHAQLNAQQTVKSQAGCTEKQLRERISLVRKTLGS